MAVISAGGVISDSPCIIDVDSSSEEQSSKVQRNGSLFGDSIRTNRDFDVISGSSCVFRVDSSSDEQLLSSKSAYKVDRDVDVFLDSSCIIDVHCSS